jgi:hypothetical protein
MKSILVAVAAALVTAIAAFGIFVWHQSVIMKARIAPLFADYTPGPEIPAPQNDQAALELLALENHMIYPVDVMISDPTMVSRYKQQLKAIDYVREHQIVAVPQLLCYLDYSTNFMALIDPAHGQQFDQLSKVFPAYHALLTIPGEIPQLKAYCLDPSRPFTSRMGALMVLHAVDNDRDAHATAVQMHDQETNPGHRHEMEKAILPPNQWFHFWFVGD